MGAHVMIGELFDGRYRLERRIGSGGMADVYLARDESLGRQVAIKILSDRYAQDDGFVERFRREASSAADLNHPNIVTVYDRGEAEGTYYIAMEYLDGPTLKDEIVRRAPLPEPEVIAWAAQGLDALDFAHRRGVIHRDVKPHNMVLTEDGRLKVTDFGIARAANSQQMTEVGSIVGTAQYLSPEQARGQVVGPQSDLYSMGIVLYEMLTGELPFTGDGAVDIAMKQVNDAPPSLRRKNRLVSPAMEQIVMRALAKDPALRYPSARAMADELRRVGRGGAVAADTAQATRVISAYEAAGAGAAATNVMGAAPPTRVQPAAAPPAPPPPKRSLLPWILVFLLLAASAAIGYVVYQQLQTSGVTIPSSIKGETCGQATQELRALGLKVASCQADTASKTVPKGAVVSSDPALGSSVDKGSSVALHASSGPKALTLTSLAGMKVGEAQTKVSDIGFPPAIVNPVDSPLRPANIVVSSTPGPGQYPPDTTITINVATGRVDLPDLSGGLTCQQAIQKLQRLTLKASCVQQPDNTVPKGQVIGIQNQTAGTAILQHSAVTVLVSSGPADVNMPSVINMPLDAARNQLKQDGFKVAVGHIKTCDQTQQDGVVASQKPDPGTTLPYGSPVSITVWRVLPPTDPSCTGGPPTTT
jgi:eukaryotic-like serine/threonine-protein kinase